MSGVNNNPNGMNISNEMYQTLFKSNYAKALVQKALDANPNDDDAVLEALHTELTKAAEADGTVTADEKSLMNALTTSGMLGFGTSKEIVKANLKEILRAHTAEANRVKFGDLHIQTQDGMLGGWGSATDRTLNLNAFDDPEPAPPKPAPVTPKPETTAPKPASNSGTAAPAANTAKPAPHPTKPAQPAQTNTKPAVHPTQTGAKPTTQPLQTPSQIETQPVAQPPAKPVPQPVANKPAEPADASASEPTPDATPTEMIFQTQKEIEAAAVQKPLSQLQLDKLPADQKKAIETQAQDRYAMPAKVKDANEDLERANMWAVDDIGSACKDIDKILKTIEANPAAYHNPDTKTLRADLARLGTLTTTKDTDGSLKTQFTLKSSPPGTAQLEALSQLKNDLKALQTASKVSEDPFAEGGALQTTLNSLLKSNPALKNDPAVQLAQQQPQLLKYADLLSTLNLPQNVALKEAILSGDTNAAQTYLNQYNAKNSSLFFGSLGYSNLFNYSPPVFGFGQGFDLGDSGSASTGLFNPTAMGLPTTFSLDTIPGIPGKMGSLSDPLQQIGASNLQLNAGLFTGSPKSTDLNFGFDSKLRLPKTAEFKPGENMSLQGVNQSDLMALAQLLKDQPAAKDALAAQNNDLSAVLKTPQGQKLKGAVELGKTFDKVLANGSYLDLASSEVADAVGKRANVLSSLELAATAVDQAYKVPGLTPEANKYLVDQRTALKSAIAQVKAGESINTKPKLDDALLQKAKEARLNGTPLSNEVLVHAGLKPRLEKYDPLFARMNDSLKNGDMQKLVEKLPEPQKSEMQQMFLSEITMADGRKQLQGAVFLQSYQDAIKTGVLPPEADFMVQSYMQNMVNLLDKAKDDKVDAAALAKIGNTQANGPVAGSPFELLNDTSRFNGYANQLMQATGDPKIVGTAMKEFFQSSSQSLKDNLSKKPVDRNKLYAELDRNFDVVQSRSFVLASFGSFSPISTPTQTGVGGVQPTAASGAPGPVQGLATDGPAKPLMTDAARLAVEELKSHGVLKNLTADQLLSLASSSNPDQMRQILGFKGNQSNTEVYGLQIKAMQAIQHGLDDKLNRLQAATNLSEAGRAAVREMANLSDGLKDRIEGTRRLQQTYMRETRLEGKTDAQLFQAGMQGMQTATGLSDDAFIQAFGTKPTPGHVNMDQIGSQLIANMTMSEADFNKKMRAAGSQLDDTHLKAAYLAFRTAAMQSAAAFNSNVSDSQSSPQMKKNARALSLLMTAHASGEIQLSDAQIEQLAKTYKDNPAQFMSMAADFATKAAKDPKHTPTATSVARMITSPDTPASNSAATSDTSAASPATSGRITASGLTDLAPHDANGAPTEGGGHDDQPPGERVRSHLTMLLPEQVSADLRDIRQGLIDGTIKPEDITEVSRRGGDVSYRLRGVDGKPARDFKITFHPEQFVQQFTQAVPAAAISLAHEINVAPPAVRQVVQQLVQPMQQSNQHTMEDYSREMTSILQERRAAVAQIAQADQKINQAMANLNQIIKENPGVVDEINQAADPQLNQASKDAIARADALEAGQELAPAPAISGDELFEKWLSDTMKIVRNWDEATRKLVLAQIAKQMMDQLINTFYKHKADDNASYHDHKIEEMNSASKDQANAVAARSQVARAGSGQAISALSGQSQASARGEAFNLEALRNKGVSGIRQQVSDDLQRARTGVPPLQISDAEAQALMAKFDLIVNGGVTAGNRRG